MPDPLLQRHQPTQRLEAVKTVRAGKTPSHPPPSFPASSQPIHPISSIRSLRRLLFRVGVGVSLSIVGIPPRPTLKRSAAGGRMQVVRNRDERERWSRMDASRIGVADRASMSTSIVRVELDIRVRVLTPESGRSSWRYVKSSIVPLWKAHVQDSKSAKIAKTR
ncbi:hypothetical protein SCHPADRAFT_894073 [Schizopora paradoxa]|uniref:Uncharacterized protein n=1 Tax=Schizopora paradoxa TaxID=27342 RepID=A0A0H2R8Q5_9AGAM|nr:hypothetical protein SCHPADRAFT_894073 [Schizopora paradoxa]